jgi:maltooligosyltrehalose trehalohydrolase
MQEILHRAQGMVGAQVGACGVTYRVWAPDARAVAVRINPDSISRSLPLAPDGEGYWSVADPNGAPGDLYLFQLDEDAPLPDVASRFQPKGVDGPSECVDSTRYGWECASWRRPGWHGQTTYELHVGTLTQSGTFRSAIPRLAEIRDLGAEAIEIMPLADFAGNRNWGYDGVSLFAPARCYGRPDDLRAMIDAAHGQGMAVILDVVYNHVGPQGGYLAKYSADYFHADKNTPWGRSFNLDGNRSQHARDLLLSNALYWLDEFRVDGLRLDATHAIVDDSPSHLVREIAELAHQRGGFVIAEDERNTVEIFGSNQGAGGVDAVWADDFHHAVRVALTGTQRSYFAGYDGTPSEIAATIRDGWTYHGQAFRPWKGASRGEPSDLLPPQSFVYCIENHDQIGNRAFGERLEQLVDQAKFRAASMLLCLNPHPPLIFMGQEWAASTPFLFFSNHGGDLGRSISSGRLREFGEGESGNAAVAPDPEDPSSFEGSKLDWSERGVGQHAAALSLYKACLLERGLLKRQGALRKESWTVHSAGPLIAVLYRRPGFERMLLVNFGDRSLFPESLPESLVAEGGASWHVTLDSEATEYGGCAASRVGKWTLHGPGALWLEARGGDDDAAH